MIPGKFHRIPAVSGRGMPLAMSIPWRYSYAIGEDSGCDGRGGVLDDDSGRRSARARACACAPCHDNARSAHDPRACGQDDDYDGDDDARPVVAWIARGYDASRRDAHADPCDDDARVARGELAFVAFDQRRPKDNDVLARRD